jgi:hypothetical protein
MSTFDPRRKGREQNVTGFTANPSCGSNKGGCLMVKMVKRHRTFLGWVCLGCFMGVILLLASQGETTSAGTNKIDYSAAYAVFDQKCTGCHGSVADPEKPGKTRDDWHLVVNVMHRHGLDLTTKQSEIIIDILYSLRKGIEKEAG